MNFTKEHEWISKEGESFRVGISEYAQTELGEVVFVDLPEVGTKVSKGDSLLTVESVKAVSDVYAPVDGEIVEVNSALEGSPELVNESPQAEAWMVAIKPSDAGQVEALMNEADYQKFVDEVSK